MLTTVFYVLMLAFGVGFALLLCGRVLPGLALWGLAWAFERALARQEQRRA